MNLTFSPKVAICSPKNFNSDQFISNVNDVVADLDFLTDEPPPPIPKELMYEPPLFKIKKMASEIGGVLEKAKSKKSLKDSDVLSSFINSDFDFTTNYQIKSHEIEPIRTVFDFISKNRKNIRFASPLYPANDILIVVSVMTSKSTNSELKRQIHQCFIALGSNTIHQITEKIVCPLCKITEVIAGPHCVPDQIEIDGKIHYNFNNGFDKTLNQILNKINCCANFKSKGGCTHLMIFNGGFAVNVDNHSEKLENPHQIISKEDTENEILIDKQLPANKKSDENSSNSDDHSENPQIISKEDTENEISSDKQLPENKKGDENSSNSDDHSEKLKIISKEDTENEILIDQSLSMSKQSDENSNNGDENSNNGDENSNNGDENSVTSIVSNFDGQLDLSFPVEFAGKGANPPPCFACKIRPGFIVVKDDGFAAKESASSIKEEKTEEEEDLNEKFPFRFFCSKCINDATFDKENAIVINLLDNFFIPLT